MKCCSATCPRPDGWTTLPCTIAGYGWAEYYHEECCPVVAGGEPCLGVHWEEAEKREQTAAGK